MPGTFENVTKVAIEEIIKSHTSASKFGYIMSEEALMELVSDFFNLLLTSRSLKTAGDRMLKGGTMQPKIKSPERSPLLR